MNYEVSSAQAKIYNILCYILTFFYNAHLIYYKIDVFFNKLRQNINKNIRLT